MKIIEAPCATSEYSRRQQISFDEKSGLILQVGDLQFPRERVDYYYGDDCLLFAGMGDVHIHAREDVSGLHLHKEDFSTARLALRNGGLCHAGDMPNNPVAPIDDHSYRQKFALAMKAQGELWIYAGIGPGTKPLPYPVPYKVYMGPSVGELFFKDLETLDETLAHYRGQSVSFHCEDPMILEQHRNEDHHHTRRPKEAEVVATRDALLLIEKYNLKGKLCHYSTAEGLQLIREARGRGVDVSIEATPQHLYFDIEDLEPHAWPFFQMNPPIRYRIDKSALMQAFKQGEIQFLATDHAPHTAEEKLKGTSGLTGLDTYGPFVTWLIQQGVDQQQLALACAENPGKFFNQFLPSWKKIDPLFEKMGQGVGFLAPGFRANFTVLNLQSGFKLDVSHLKTKVQHNPFLGEEFPGQVAALFIGGQKV
jgi:dihydroorotase